MGNGVYEEFTPVSGYICNILFSVDEDGFGTRRIASVCKLFRRYQDLKKKLFEFKNHSRTSDRKFKDV